MPADELLAIGSFPSEDAILAAARAAKKAGHVLHDAYTPFPVHGMDQALDLPHSKLPRACFAYGFAGLAVALSFQYGVSLFDWPMNIGGKSYDASPALIPVAFELTVLFAGLGTVFTFLRRRRLYPGKKSAFEGLKASDDRFLLALKCPEGYEAAARFLKQHGASEVLERGGAA